MKLMGAALILLGLVGLLGGIPFRQTREVARVGDFRMRVTEEKRATLPKYVSAAAVIVGAVLLAAGSRKPTA